MRILSCTLLGVISLTASLSAAQIRNQTEAQQDGLGGAVKSVTTLRQTPRVQWQQPAGPTLVMPAWCHACDYDQSGYRTRSGDVVDGKFIGESITLDRDPSGNLISRHAVDAATGKVIREERFGPYGRTELDAYQNGALITHQVFRYDENGKPSEWLTWNGTGTSTGRDTWVWSKDGTELENSSWAGDGTLMWRHTYDPASDRDEMAVNEQSGAPALRRAALHGSPASFWEASDSPDRFGQSFVVDRGNGDMEVRACHRATGCAVSRVHYEYAGPGKLNPTSAEWRDAGGNLQWAAYYDYEFDSAHNWTHRKVWVVSPEQTGRTLLEEDWRTISYWNN
ncbi:MAG TPA: hypothetical protein VGL22_18705 [Terracidiphilus sp.]